MMRMRQRAGELLAFVVAVAVLFVMSAWAQIVHALANQVGAVRLPPPGRFNGMGFNRGRRWDSPIIAPTGESLAAAAQADALRLLGRDALTRDGRMPLRWASWNGDTDPVDGKLVGFIPIRGGAGLALMERYIATLNLTNSQASFLDLPRDFKYAGLLLRLAGTVTVAGGATSGTLVDEHPMSYLNKIVVEGTGSGQSLQLKNYRGPHAFALNHLLTGRESNAVTLPNANVAAGTPFSCVVPVQFMLNGANLPPEVAVNSILDPDEFGKLTLEIDAGSSADFINGGDRTNTVNAGVTLDVYAIQAVNVNLANSKTRPYRYQEVFLLRDQVAALASERAWSNPLPTGRPYRYVAWRVTDETSNKRQPVDDTVGALKLLISSTVVYRYNSFREYVDRQRQVVRAIDAVNPSGLNALSSRDNFRIGWYVLDFIKDGRLEGSLDASRFPSRGIPLDMRMDILTASTRQIDLVCGFLTPGGARM